MGLWVSFYCESKEKNSIVLKVEGTLAGNHGKAGKLGRRDASV